MRPGYRHARYGGPVSVGNDGYSWSSASYNPGDHYRALDLYFSSQHLSTSRSDYRALGFQLRCLSE